MKTIIAGSRSISSYDTVERVIRASGFQVSEALCGGAPGVDRLGEQWAKKSRIPIRYFHALWNLYGKQAGRIRNIQMAERADALIAVWDGRSPGTKHMLDEAQSRGLKVYMEVV